MQEYKKNNDIPLIEEVETKINLDFYFNLFFFKFKSNLQRYKVSIWLKSQLIASSNDK